MSLPRPIHPYYFHADLIWWDGPFKRLPVQWGGGGGDLCTVEQRKKKEIFRYIIMARAVIVSVSAQQQRQAKLLLKVRPIKC